MGLLSTGKQGSCLQPLRLPQLHRSHDLWATIPWRAPSSSAIWIRRYRGLSGYKYIRMNWDNAITPGKLHRYITPVEEDMFLMMRPVWCAKVPKAALIWFTFWIVEDIWNTKALANHKANTDKGYVHDSYAPSQVCGGDFSKVHWNSTGEYAWTESKPKVNLQYAKSWMFE